MSDYLTNCDPDDETDFRTNDAFDSSGCLNLSREEFERQNIEDAERAARRYGYKDNDEMMQAMGC